MFLWLFYGALAVFLGEATGGANKPDDEASQTTDCGSRSDGDVCSLPSSPPIILGGTPSPFLVGGGPKSTEGMCAFVPQALFAPPCGDCVYSTPAPR